MLPVAGRPVQDGIVAFGSDEHCNPCARAVSSNGTAAGAKRQNPAAAKKGAAVAGGSR